MFSRKSFIALKVVSGAFFVFCCIEGAYDLVAGRWWLAGWMGLCAFAQLVSADRVSTHIREIDRREADRRG